MPGSVRDVSESRPFGHYFCPSGSRKNSSGVESRDGYSTRAILRKRHLSRTESKSANAVVLLVQQSCGVRAASRPAGPIAQRTAIARQSMAKCCIHWLVIDHYAGHEASKANSSYRKAKGGPETLRAMYVPMNSGWPPEPPWPTKAANTRAV
jgi:hypothetical protein